MLVKFKFLAYLVFLSLLLTGCDEGSESNSPAVPDTISSLRLIGTFNLLANADPDGTTVGGLSAIEYDSLRQTWYLLSDDRSQQNPSRFYEASVVFDANRLQTVSIQNVIELKKPDGNLFGLNEADPEAIRYDAQANTFYWTSEGDRSQLISPSLRESTLMGDFVGEIPLPSLFAFDNTEEVGPRNNGTLEGLAFSKNGQNLVAAMELPLFQDGSEPSDLTSLSPCRISIFDKSTRQLTAQYAYLIDAVANAPQNTNGMTEILALTDSLYLVLERSFEENQGFNAKLYEIDISQASDISSLDSLAQQAFTPVSKRLLLDFSTLDQSSLSLNLEGMCWGPRLANGHRSLVLVADNNFNALIPSFFVALEVIP